MSKINKIEIISHITINIYIIKPKKAQLCKLACQFLGCDGLVVVVDKQLNNNNNNNNNNNDNNKSS